jgi:predicted RNase H-like HicB family nuclease
MTASKNNGINVEYDRETGEYFVIWEPLVVAAGKTVKKTLEDLRAAAHSGVDKLIDLKLKNTN